jgi:ubiquinone/menaquinone biosynthesis C-methylase UbiE
MSMEISRRMAAAYDRVAGEFAQKNAMMPADLLEVGPRFLAQAGPGATILDVGCGAGRDLAWLQAHGVAVVGVDLSAGMLAQARPHAPGRLFQVDMRDVPFTDGAFGGVWSSASLLHLPKQDAPRALAEMHRVLAPRGPLMLSIQEGDGEVWETWPDGTVERFFARYRPEELAALLDTAGFQVTERHVEQTPNRRWLRLLATRTT